MTNEFNYEDITDEELYELNWRQAVKNAQTVLDLYGQCYEKFGKRLLSEEQKECFEKLACREPLADYELETMRNGQIGFQFGFIKRNEESAFMDKTDGLVC